MGTVTRIDFWDFAEGFFTVVATGMVAFGSAYPGWWPVLVVTIGAIANGVRKVQAGRRGNGVKP